MYYPMSRSLSVCLHQFICHILKGNPSMKTDASAFSASQRALVYSALLCVLAFVPIVLGDPSTVAILRSAPLSLPRLSAATDKLGLKPIRAEAFEVLRLSTAEHAKQKLRGSAAYLEIEPGVVWQQKLRNQRAGANYVSFTLNASLATQIDIGGASVVIEQSEKDQTYAAVQTTTPGRSIHHEMPWMLFGGARMATLDIVTVKVDRQAHTWAMWFRDTVVAEDMPLASQDSVPQIRITAGKGGAWLCGLVCSDENPLFEDTNDNAVPDDFELRILGNLLSKNASEQTKANLRLAWDEEKRSRPPSEFVLTTPQPDSFPVWCAPDGAPVHGMVGGLKFSSAKKN